MDFCMINVPPESETDNEFPTHFNKAFVVIANLST